MLFLKSAAMDGRPFDFAVEDDRKNQAFLITCSAMLFGASA
ncbi:MAG: hypothetical protein RSP_23390 [Rhodanobacter sp.]